MPDEQAPEGVEVQEEGAQAPAEDTRTVDDIRADSRARRDQRRREAIAKERDELKARIAEIEKAERDAEQERQRKAGEFDKIESRLTTELRDVREQLEAAQATIQAGKTNERRRKFVEAVVKEGGITNSKVATAMLATLDIESAPEHFTSKDARDAAKLLRAEAPEIFGGGSTNDPKPPPGGGKPAPQKGSDEYYRQLGADYTSRGANTPYARAKRGFERK